MDGEEPGMTLHLRLLAEQAEEALRQQSDLKDQATTVALDVKQVRPGPMRKLMARIARRHGGQEGG
jgi:hypothetical protein